MYAILLCRMLIVAFGLRDVWLSLLALANASSESTRDARCQAFGASEAKNLEVVSSHSNRCMKIASFSKKKKTKTHYLLLLD